MTLPRLISFAFLVLLMASRLAASQALQFSSGERQVTLVELYTSEGCNSCPPADRWLSELKTDAALWQRFVPIAWHVDYWDYIGWPDRFAQAEFGRRHQRYVRQGGASFAYTPHVFSNGAEWRGWTQHAAWPEPAIVGPLSVSIDGVNIAVHFEPAEKPAAGLTLHVAVLGMDLSSDVRAGENAGKLLRHDFVVLAYKSAALAAGAGGFTASLRLPVIDEPVDQRAFVAWLSAVDNQAPIQALGGYLDRD
jgi:hypothetical protein